MGTNAFNVPDNGRDIKYFFSTGDDIFDMQVSNRKHGGIPAGRIT